MCRSTFPSCCYWRHRVAPSTISRVRVRRKQWRDRHRSSEAGVACNAGEKLTWSGN
ncbi:hypothetical protein M758_11G104900 [Ceratodon purpureus]|nr:hypothetical protein M758_11G104900 [Ceratodon purpureus]